MGKKGVEDEDWMGRGGTRALRTRHERREAPQEIGWHVVAARREETVRTAKRTADPNSMDARREIVRGRIQENERLAAVYAAREQRTRAVEGRGDGWREGRACSVADWQAPRGEEWQVVGPSKWRQNRRHKAAMKLGARI